jgi:predicted protein tyrosine phosphatase
MNDPLRKQILVKSAIEAQYFTSPVPWACISITSTSIAWPRISDADRIGLLQLAFADIRYPEYTSDSNYFNSDHAGCIQDFLGHVWNDIDLLMVHCEAGTSRSPAVAAAISRQYYGDDGGFLIPHLFRPNMHVYRQMLHVAEQRKLLL